MSLMEKRLSLLIEPFLQEAFICPAPQIHRSQLSFAPMSLSRGLSGVPSFNNEAKQAFALAACNSAQREAFLGLERSCEAQFIQIWAKTMDFLRGELSRRLHLGWKRLERQQREQFFREKFKNTLEVFRSDNDQSKSSRGPALVKRILRFAWFRI